METMESRGTDMRSDWDYDGASYWNAKLGIGIVPMRCGERNGLRYVLTDGKPIIENPTTWLWAENPLMVDGQRVEFLRFRDAKAYAKANPRNERGQER